MKLPRRIVLPKGYIVRIRLKSHSWFMKRACLALWENYVGGGTIYLDKSRKRAKRWLDLEHELHHAFVDWLDHYLER